MESNLLRNVLKPNSSKRPSIPKRTTNFRNIDFSPLHWSNYFEESRDLEVSKSNGKFRIYLSGFRNQTNPNAPVLVLLHGGGYSALTWSLFVKQLNEICDCKIIALDLRGHGSTITDNDYDLSIETMVNDIYNVLVCFFNENQTVDQDVIKMYSSIYEPNNESAVNRLPNLCLIGHSFGACLAVNSAYKLSSICTITGLIVIDVVEGTALEALQGMHLVLKNRQSSFNSIRDAIEWCVSNNQTKNIEAARVSFPGQIKNRLTNKTASDELDNVQNNEKVSITDNKLSIQQDDSSSSSLEEQSNNLKRCKISGDAIPEDDEMTNDGLDNQFRIPLPKDYSDGKYIWRIDLFKSEPYWRSWFENLSKLFLNAPTSGRLLLLAGIDRLDKDLTIGQMQGKFQMQVLPQCGHAVHEDVPDKVAEAMATYLIRLKLVEKKKQFQPTFPCC